MRIAHTQEVRANTLSIGEYDLCKLVKVIDSKHNDIYKCFSEFGNGNPVSLICFPSRGVTNNKYTICNAHEI
jgi:hypothetical protein